MSDERIVAALRALARETSAERPSPRIEEELLAAFDAHRGAGPKDGREWVTWIGAAAAVLLFAGGFWLAQFDGTAGPAFRSGAVETSGFIPWPGAAALPAFESGQLVRTELPASVLPLLGLSQADAPAADYVTADVLYAQDGLARAVRIVLDRSMNP